MSVWATGDTHIIFDRFSTKNFPEQKTMSKSDIVLVCGDFGFWDNSKENRYWLSWLDDKPFTTAFVAGNHDNYDMLAELPEEAWCGGKVNRIMDSIIHLKRGEIYTIQGKTFFTFGGARSQDIQDGILEPDDPFFKEKKKALDKKQAMYRINHKSWWKEEMPTQEEMEYGLANLAKHGNKVDYIITHDGPHKAMNLIYPGWIKRDELNTYFDKLSETVSFSKWFFGHHHENRNIDRKYVLLYEQIIPVIY